MTTKNGGIEVLSAIGSVRSKREARRLVEQGAVKLDGKKITDVDYVIKLEDLPQVLQVGKRRWTKLVRRKNEILYGH